MLKNLLFSILVFISLNKVEANTPDECLSLAARQSFSIKFLMAIKANNGCDNLIYKDLDSEKESKKNILLKFSDELKAKKTISKSSLANMDEVATGELSSEEICPYIESKMVTNLNNRFDLSFKDSISQCPEKKESFLKDFEKVHSDINYFSADLSTICLDLKNKSEKLETDIKDCSHAVAGSKPKCEKAQVITQLAELIAKDNHKIFNQQRKLTLLKLTNATAKSNSKTLEAFINKQSKVMSVLNHANVKEDLIRLYQKNGKFDNVQDLKSLIDKNDFSFWNKHERLQDKDLSILVMAQRTGSENSGFTEADSAIIWANSLITEQLPLGSAQANRLLLSGEIARLR